MEWLRLWYVLMINGLKEVGIKIVKEGIALLNLLNGAAK